VTERVGLGVLGCGRMGSAHARIIAGLVPEARLAALGDVQVDAARRLAPEVGNPRVHGSAEALAADPEVQAVLVAVSSSRHLDAVRAIAAVGKDILCEKPLALTLMETDAAIAAADAAGVRLQVAFMRRHDPDHRRAKERLASGRLGRPILFQSLQFDMEPPPLAFCDPAVSGGIFVDMGIHEFDLARWLMDDEVVEVIAYGTTLSHPELATVGDVDSAVAILRFAGGATGAVKLARDTTYGEDVRTEVLATGGSVWLGSLQAGHSAVSGPRTVASDFPDPSIPRFERAYAEQTRAFVRAIAAGEPVSVTGHDARAALAIAIAADRSMREGRPVTIAEVATPPAP
jgi:predicted dehydrogenase